MKKNFVNLFSKKGIICLFFCMSVGQLPAQENLPTVKTPVSPVAASFNVYGEIPVSKYTGIPDISIPLYTIDLGSLQIPISLSYHPAGVRVEAEASWVGLGWTLTAGGTISREIKGLDDFKKGGHWWRFNIPNVSADFKKPIPTSPIGCDYWTLNELCDCYFYLDKRIDIGCSTNKRSLKIDCEPDLFTYNFLGYSGRFVMKEGENIAILEKPEDGLDIKINRISDSVIYIDVTLPNGDICHFYQYEEATPYQGSSMDSANGGGTQTINTWHLTSIELMDGNYLSFDYIAKHNIDRNAFQTHIYQSNNLGVVPYPRITLNKELVSLEVPSSTCGGIEALSEFSSNSTIKSYSGSYVDTELYLSKISWNGNCINFIHSTRADYGTVYDVVNQPLCLKEMEIRNQKNKLVKGYSFGYSYFEKTGVAYSKRLRLESINEYGVTGALPPYRFTYDTRYDLPSKTSLSFDVWGYYNGSPSFGPSENLFPEIILSGNTYYFNWESPERSGTVSKSGRNMRCNSNYITTAMLKKIIEFT